MVYGGLFEIYVYSFDEEKSKYLKDVFIKIYIKDILERYNIYNEKEVLEILLNFIFFLIGLLINLIKLLNRFLLIKNIKIVLNIILNYLDYFCELFIILKVYRYDIKGSFYF